MPPVFVPAPEHETRVRDIVLEEIPGCSVSLSCEVLPQIREYYRLSTTVINAYLQPILARYIAQLDRRISGAGIATRQKYIMQSNGGMATFAAAARRAVTTVLSGPAGGVTAGVLACGMSGSGNIITFDMGGTSCDVALIRDGEPLLSSCGKIEGRDLAVPMLDINTVSAGGGTIATVDRFRRAPGRAAQRGCSAGTGLLRTRRRGADHHRLQPGARLSRGRQLPRRTDAARCGQGPWRDRDRGGGATRPRRARGGRRHYSRHRREDGRSDQGDFHHARHDLRDFMLLAFGGAGPLHAGRIARDLGMAGVIVPLYPGVFSAIGLLMSDVKHDYVRSKLTPLSEISPADVNGMFERMVAQALDELRDDGFSAEQIRIERALDMRYAGQGYEIAVSCSAHSLQEADLKQLRAAFDQQHRTMFGHMAPDEPVEIVSYRVRGIGLVPPVEMPQFKTAGTTLADAQREMRRVRFDGREVDCPVYQRERLDVGLRVAGPAVLDQFDCTTVICPGQTARVDEWKNLMVT
jgi:N-methylhydantoinase A